MLCRRANLLLCKGHQASLRRRAGADAPASNAYIWGAIFPDETSVTYKPIQVPGDLPLVAGEVQMATNWACGLAANGSAWCIGAWVGRAAAAGRCATACALNTKVHTCMMSPLAWCAGLSHATYAGQTVPAHAAPSHAAGTTYSAVPEVVNGSATYSQLATSKWSGYVCGIRADDQTLECWGAPAGCWQLWSAR